MRQQIKIFTALFLALTTMPVLAIECKYGKILQDDKGKDYCQCAHLTDEPKGLETYNENNINFVEYNRNGHDQCDEWVYLDKQTPCIHKGHATAPQDYLGKNIKQSGYCLVFGRDFKRNRIRELAEQYRNKHNEGKGIINPGDKITIVDTKSTSNPKAVMDEWAGRTNYEAQPTVMAIIKGYKELCENNGPGFDFVESYTIGKAGKKDQITEVYYECQEKPSTLSGDTRALQTNNPTADTSKLTLGNDKGKETSTGSTGSGNGDSRDCENPDKSGKICVYDIATKTYKVYTFNVKAPNNRKKDIKSIVYEYNKIAVQEEFILPVLDIIAIVDKNMENASPYRNTLEQEESIKAVISGYTTLCARNENHNGVTETSFLSNKKDYPYGRKCIATACNETTYTLDNKNHTCVLKPGSSKQSATNSGTQKSWNKPTDQEINSIVKTLERPVTLNTQIDIPEELRQEKKILYALQTWKNKCSEILKNIPDDNVEKRGVQTPSDNSFAKCFVQCKNNATFSAKQKKCVLINQDKQTTPEWTPNFAEPKLGNHINVPKEHAKEDAVIKWISDANAAIAAAGGANEVETSTDSNGETVYTCIIIRCADANKVPNSYGTACIDSAKKLEADISGIDVAGEKPDDVEIKQQAVKTCAEQYPSNETAAACCVERGKWYEEQKICVCPNQANGEFWDSATQTCIYEDYEREDEPRQGFDIEEETEELEKKSKKQSEALPLPESEMIEQKNCEAAKDSGAKWNKDKCECKGINKEWNGQTCIKKTKSAKAPKCPADAPWDEDECECMCTDTAKVYHKKTNTCIEKKCDDQNVEHIISENQNIKKDADGNEYIETSVEYKTCGILKDAWIKKCEGKNMKGEVITEDEDKLILKCTPKESDKENKANERSEEDKKFLEKVEEITKAFNDKVKAEKDKLCKKQVAADADKQ